MNWTSQIAAQHSALWGFDRWYRLWWYIWPASLALLISGWICIDKPAGKPASSSPWATPVPNAPSQPIRRSPTLANWPEKLQNDVVTCFANAIDIAPLVDACTRLIVSEQISNAQMVSVYSRRGVLRRLTEPDLALADYNSALNIQADAPAVLTNRAWIYMTRNRYDAALEDLNKAITLFVPTASAQARRDRGYVLFRLKEYDRAMSDLNEAQKLDPNDANGYLTRAVVEKAKQLYDAALQDFDEFIKRAPSSPRGFAGRGSVLEETGRLKEALAAYESAVALDPANSELLAARDRLRSKQDSGNH